MKRIIVWCFAILLYTTSFSQTSITLEPSKDASVGFHDGYDSDDTNFGNATHYSAFSQPSTAGSGENSGWGIMDFDLSSIPGGATITSATLNLYAFGDGFSIPLPDGHDGDNSSYLSRITSSWNEGTVTWNTKPDITNENRVTLSESSSPEQDYLDIDVTALVQDMIDAPGTSFGFCLNLIDESPTQGLLFASSDYADDSKIQKLTIIYTGGNAIQNPSNSNYPILVYPNPTENEFIIQLDLENSANVSYELTDINGKLIFSSELGILKNGITDIALFLDQPNISAGTYLLILSVNDKKQSIKIYKTN